MRLSWNPRPVTIVSLITVVHGWQQLFTSQPVVAKQTRLLLRRYRGDQFLNSHTGAQWRPPLSDPGHRRCHPLRPAARCPGGTAALVYAGDFLVGPKSRPVRRVPQGGVSVCRGDHARTAAAYFVFVLRRRFRRRSLDPSHAPSIYRRNRSSSSAGFLYRSAPGVRPFSSVGPGSVLSPSLRFMRRQRTRNLPVYQLSCSVEYETDASVRYLASTNVRCHDGPPDEPPSSPTRKRVKPCAY